MKSGRDAIDSSILIGCNVRAHKSDFAEERKENESSGYARENGRNRGLSEISAFVFNKTMKVLLSAEQIQQRVMALARQIAGDFQERPVTIVGVLTGSLMFLADLVRHLNLPLRIGLIQASSYRGPTTKPGELRISPELLPDVKGRHVLLLDDILDTGRTLDYLVRHLRGLDVASVRVGVLLRKLGRQELSLEPDYVGFDIPNAFVVGYGLDFNDEYRHLPHIAMLDADAHP
jgi:hypoxanthine phosphoribosyltransferase